MTTNSNTVLNFKDKVVLVTGAASGIGAGIAIYLYKLGATLSLLDKDELGLNETLKECLLLRNEQPKPLLVIGDITDHSIREEYVSKTVNQFGHIHVLVNNAGIAPTDTIETTSMETLDTVLTINLKAPFHLTQLVIPYLKMTKGSIVNISSMVTSKTSVVVLSYSLSKGAVDMLTKVTSAELGVYGIRVNSVNPGLVATNLYKQTFPGIDKESIREKSAKRSALGRCGEPLDIARVVAFLASEEAAFVTGVNLLADGGVSVHNN